MPFTLNRRGGPQPEHRGLISKFEVNAGPSRPVANARPSAREALVRTKQVLSDAAPAELRMPGIAVRVP